MDAEYLRQNVGACLSECLADVCMKRPVDPIEYIAHWLYKHIENVSTKNQVIRICFTRNIKFATMSNKKLLISKRLSYVMSIDPFLLN